jgi:excisionase family DNA binding protein
MLAKHTEPERNQDQDEQSSERMWTVDDVAKYLCINPETVRIMVRRGDLPAHKIGKLWRFTPLEIQQHIKNK